MSETFHIKQGDSAPNLRAILKNPDGTAASLVGSTVRFSMRTSGGAVIVSRQPCALVDAPNGVVEYDWQDGDTDTGATHLGEFEVTYSDGSIETFPNDGFVRIMITKQIA